MAMKSEIEVFREFVRRKGLRNTPEREQVIRMIFATHEHFDVDGLYSLLRRRKGKISRATVYRTIPLLIESGLLQEAYVENGRMRYEHIYGHERHCHLRCLGCGGLVEFAEQSVAERARSVAERYEFVVTGHRVEVYGYCPKCKAHR
jgi:Fur family ferric uptake transcriptional regulator